MHCHGRRSVEVGGLPHGHGVHRSAAHALHLPRTRMPAAVRSPARTPLAHRPQCQGALTLLLLLLLGCCAAEHCCVLAQRCRLRQRAPVCRPRRRERAACMPGARSPCALCAGLMPPPLASIAQAPVQPVHHCHALCVHDAVHSLPTQASQRASRDMRGPLSSAQVMASKSSR